MSKIFADALVLKGRKSLLTSADDSNSSRFHITQGQRQRQCGPLTQVVCAARAPPQLFHSRPGAAVVEAAREREREQAVCNVLSALWGQTVRIDFAAARLVLFARRTHKRAQQACARYYTRHVLAERYR